MLLRNRSAVLMKLKELNFLHCFSSLHILETIMKKQQQFCVLNCLFVCIRLPLPLLWELFQYFKCSSLMASDPGSQHSENLYSVSCKQWHFSFLWKERSFHSFLFICPSSISQSIVSGQTQHQQRKIPDLPVQTESWNFCKDFKTVKTYLDFCTEKDTQNNFCLGKLIPCGSLL